MRLSFRQAAMEGFDDDWHEGERGGGPIMEGGSSIEVIIKTADVDKRGNVRLIFFVTESTQLTGSNSHGRLHRDREYRISLNELNKIK